MCCLVDKISGINSGAIAAKVADAVSTAASTNYLGVIVLVNISAPYLAILSNVGKTVSFQNPSTARPCTTACNKVSRLIS